MITKKLDSGFYPVEKETKKCFQIMLYSAFLVPVAMLPWAANITGQWSMFAGVLLSLFMYYPAVKLYFTLDQKYAKQLMMLSFIYLPLLFGIFIVLISTNYFNTVCRNLKITE